jgi:hypothetical protein
MQQREQAVLAVECCCCVDAIWGEVDGYEGVIDAMLGVDRCTLSVKGENLVEISVNQAL